MTQRPKTKKRRKRSSKRESRGRPPKESRMNLKKIKSMLIKLTKLHRK